MNIATVSVIQNYPINSWGKSLSFFVNNTLGKEHPVNFYYFNQDRYTHWFTTDTVYFQSVYKTSSLSRFFRFLPWFIQMMRFEFLFDRSSLRDIKADIVLLEFPYLYHIAKIISHYNNNCPIVLLAHNIEWQYFKWIGSFLWLFVYLYEDSILKKMKHIISISPTDVSYLKRKYRHSKVTYLQPWTIEELFSPEGSTVPFDKNYKHILFYGRLDNPVNKEALSYIKQEILPHISSLWKIHILWSWEVESTFFENTSFINHKTVDNPYDYIRSSDAVILPLKSPAGVKVRMIEALYAEKIVLWSPESVEWLAPELQSCVTVCKSTEDYLQALTQISTDAHFIEQRIHFIHETMTLYKKNIRSTLLEVIKDL